MSGAETPSRPRPLRAAAAQALQEAWAGGAGLALPASFFAFAAILVPLGAGTEPGRLALAAPGLLWSALALSSLLVLERVFQADLEDGALELWAQSEAPLSAVAAAKTLAHWAVSGLPLAVLAPLFWLLFGLPAEDAPRAALAYGLGGLAFFAWGGLGAALAAGVRRGGLLIAVLALPLYVPTLLLGILAVRGGDGGSLALLAAVTAFSWALAPFATGAALRMGAD